MMVQVSVFRNYFSDVACAFLECDALASLWPKRRQAAALQGGAHHFEPL